MSESLTERKHLNVKVGYKPDLEEMLSQCELNYWLLKQLSPRFIGLAKEKDNSAGIGEKFQFKTKAVILEFEVTDLAPYTTTAKLMIKTPKIGLKRCLDLIVRLYHDAKMVEVMEGSGPAAMAAIYPTANVQQKNVDEKRQVNRFVGECLRACFDITQLQLVNSHGEK
ncbi:DUF1249 domain-containing protein [Aliikangiella sp. IMCC44359]|uniref:DUF1249 domain-containing protein n=1 Tax=Aliikangiella sp. IMCC44359 TaxID=3459125 RepID=UPI00403B1D4C